MAHYAKVINGVVTEVVVANSEFINKYKSNGPGVWVQTSYNTRGGQYIGSENKQQLRGNFAGIGYTYDKDQDVFIPPQPYPSWVLNQDTLTWMSPIPAPNDGENYIWNESTVSWDAVPSLSAE